jgi:amino acid permease
MSSELQLTDTEIQTLTEELNLAKANVKPALAMFFAHGYVYFFCWNIFVLVQIATARYMRNKWETNMVLHTAFGMLIAFSTIFWGFWAINNQKGWDSNKYDGKIVG